MLLLFSTDDQEKREIIFLLARRNGAIQISSSGIASGCFHRGRSLPLHLDASVSQPLNFSLGPLAVIL